MSVIKKVVKKVLPPHKPAGRFIKKQAAKVGLAKDVFYDAEYSRWQQFVEPKMFLPVVDSNDGSLPLFSIVVPFYNPKEKYIGPLFDSIVNQTFQNWELIVADGSSIQAISESIRGYCEQDKRIKYHKITKNTDISGNTNQGLEKAIGEYIVFCDHDDVLSIHALNEAAAAIADNPEIDILYSDEDKLSDNGKYRHSPFFKPDWSPHLFLYTNYTNHLSVIRTSIVRNAGGLDPQFNGSQDYELLLRIHATAESQLTVKHIPKVLYYWREAEGSTAIGHGQKSYAATAAQRALENYFSNKGIEATINTDYDGDGYFMEVFPPKADTKVAIIVDISEDNRESQALIHRLRTLTRTSLNVAYYSSRDNVENSDVTVEINQFALPEFHTWLDELVGVLQLDITAAVSPRIISSDRSRVVDMGLVYDRHGKLLPIHAKQGIRDLTIGGGAMRVRNVDALSDGVRVYRTHQGVERKKGQHYVVWSTVDFVAYNVFGKQSYFNPNLYVTEDDRITVCE